MPLGVDLHDHRCMRLICGVDTTSDDPSATEFAVRVSGELGADLTLAHFVPASAAFPAEGAGAVRDALMTAIADHVGETLARGRGDAEGMLGFGDPAYQLLSLAETESAAMIVVGSRGRGAAKAAVLGSVSRRVVVGARCPVTVVPRDTGAGAQDDAAEAKVDTIVVGYDGSPESVVALQCAAACARPLDAVLIVVQVTDPPAVGYVPGMGVFPLSGLPADRKPAELYGREATEGLPPDVTTEFEAVEGYPAQAIVEVAERAGAGLIVVGSRGRGPVGEMMLGSTSSALACEGTRPVMICTRKARVPSPIA